MLLIATKIKTIISEHHSRDEEMFLFYIYKKTANRLKEWQNGKQLTIAIDSGVAIVNWGQTPLLHA